MAGRSLDIRRGKAKCRIAEWKKQETTTRAIAMVVFCLATIFSLWQMTYISEWPSALFNDILYCIEGWPSLRNESTPIYDRFIFTPLTVCVPTVLCSIQRAELHRCIEHKTVGWKEFPIKVNDYHWFFLSEWLWPSYRNDGGIFEMTAMIFLPIWPQKYDLHLQRLRREIFLLP